MSDQYFSDRAVGQLPLSIATSLAIESALGIHPEIEVKTAPILEYAELWVNIRTLFRNFHGALDNQDANSISPQAAAATIQQEMDQLESTVKQASPTTAIIYYVSNYKDIDSRYKMAVIRPDNTTKQKEYTLLQKQTIEHLLTSEGKNGRVKIFDLKLKLDHQPKAMILTHYAFDLCSAKQFSELVLLESYTGKIKERAQWYTKYLNGKDLVQIPFNEGFLQVFGDSETFRPMDIRFRRAILEIAEKYKWSAVTTHDKMMYGIGQLQNPYYKEVLRKIIN